MLTSRAENSRGRRLALWHSFSCIEVAELNGDHRHSCPQRGLVEHQVCALPANSDEKAALYHGEIVGIGREARLTARDGCAFGIAGMDHAAFRRVELVAAGHRVVHG